MFKVAVGDARHRLRNYFQRVDKSPYNVQHCEGCEPGREQHEGNCDIEAPARGCHLLFGMRFCQIERSVRYYHDAVEAGV